MDYEWIKSDLQRPLAINAKKMVLARSFLNRMSALTESQLVVRGQAVTVGSVRA